MKPGGGKQKGAAFERDVCKKLSKWISYGEREDLFWRSAMSGGRATLGLAAGKKHSSQAGDISSVHYMGNAFINRFVIECKHVANLQIPTFLFDRKGNLNKFWLKLRQESDDHGKFSVLIAKQNRLPILWIHETDIPRVPLLFLVDDDEYSMRFYKFIDVLDKAVPDDLLWDVE